MPRLRSTAVVMLLALAWLAPAGCQKQPASVAPHAEGPAPGPRVTHVVADGLPGVYAGLPGGPAADGLIILENDGYTVGFSTATLTPRWAAYRLFAVGEVETARPNISFRQDSRIGVSLRHGDYTNTGYDRGHMAPSDGIARCYGPEAQVGTFVVSNICPQHPGLNQRAWERFEHKESHDYAERLGEVWIVTGPIFDGPCFEFTSGVRVPDAFFKIVVAEIDDTPEMLAIIMNNERTENSRVEDYITTVDEIELRAGLDFFSGLEDAVEAAAEANAVPHPAWRVTDELRPTFAGSDRPINVRPCD